MPETLNPKEALKPRKVGDLGCMSVYVWIEFRGSRFGIFLRVSGLGSARLFAV